MSTYLTDLAQWLREAGVNVVEVEGWQTRARSSGGYAEGRPWCVMWHHTASSTSPANDVSYIVSGSPDAPLANLYLARDGTVHVCAAGATNTNGKGGPLTTSRGVIPRDAMNTHGLGIEAANTGTGEAWSQAQIDTYFAVSNTLTARLGLLPTDVATHAAWAPDRKIDPATATAVLGPWRPHAINSSGTWDVDDVRNECAARSVPIPVPPEPQPKGDLMYVLFTIAGHGGDTFGGLMDGNGIIPQVTWLSPNRDAACRAAGAEDIGALSPSDLGNTDLLGPCPEGTPRETFANVIGG